MNLNKAEKELKKLQALNDGKEYCITMSYGGKFTVGEKTKDQKAIDESDPVTANKKVTDFLKDHDIKDDLH